MIPIIILISFLVLFLYYANKGTNQNTNNMVKNSKPTIHDKTNNEQIRQEDYKPSISLNNFKFLSDDHTRINNGQKSDANNKGAWRGIRIKSYDNKVFYVTIYTMSGNHPMWGDNIQMSEKQMKMVKETKNKIILRGFGTDNMGYSFSDYGITLHKTNNQINKISLHMYAKNAEIIYEKASNKLQTKNTDNYSDFDNFKNFHHKWNTSISLEDKMRIAMQSDILNNKGADAYEIDDINTAIEYFDKALKLMPNNDDALKNLRLCYSKIGNYAKVEEMEKKLRYLS